MCLCLICICTYCHSHVTIVCIHRKNGESDIRISKRKLRDVLGKVKKIVFRRERGFRSQNIIIGKGPCDTTVPHYIE